MRLHRIYVIFVLQYFPWKACSYQNKTNNRNPVNRLNVHLSVDRKTKASARAPVDRNFKLSQRILFGTLVSLHNLRQL